MWFEIIFLHIADIFVGNSQFIFLHFRAFLHAQHYERALTSELPLKALIDQTVVNKQYSVQNISFVLFLFIPLKGFYAPLPSALLCLVAVSLVMAFAELFCLSLLSFTFLFVGTTSDFWAFLHTFCSTCIRYFALS